MRKKYATALGLLLCMPAVLLLNACAAPRDPAATQFSMTQRVRLVSAEFGPAPAPTAEVPHPRAPMLPDSFEVLVVAPR